MKSILFASLLALSITACAQPQTSAPSTTTPVSVDNLGPSLPAEHPAVELPPTSASIKRLTVTMLSNSLPIVAGEDATGQPITWTVLRPGGDKPIPALEPQALGRALGHPDYLEVTVEPAQPTALYVKFMDDMARDVCDKMLESDIQQPNSEQRQLVRFSPLNNVDDIEAIDANLRYLMLRFLGQRVAPDDVESIEALRTAFVTSATAATTEPPQKSGWRTVCVALLSSPAFHLY